MSGERIPDAHDQLATFIMLYQEAVGSPNRAASSSTHTLTREQVDHLELETRTDNARESTDPDAITSHGTFPPAAATQTFSESRENIDSDVSPAHSVFQAEALTKTGAREQDDADVRATFLAIPCGIETKTFSKDQREHSDTDVSQSVFTTFPPRA